MAKMSADPRIEIEIRIRIEIDIDIDIGWLIKLAYLGLGFAVYFRFNIAVVGGFSVPFFGVGVHMGTGMGIWR